MSKIKVLHKVSNGIGGIERYFFNCLKYIDRDKFSFDILTRSNEFEKTESYKIYGFGINKFSVTDRENNNIFRSEIERIMGQGYDVVHLHTSQWTGFLLEEIAKEVGIKKIIIHSRSSSASIPAVENISNYEEQVTKYINIHERYKEKFSEEYGTDFCAVSRNAAQWLFGDKIPREKIHIMHNALDMEKFSFNLSRRVKYRRELGYVDECVIGCCGSLKDVKNIAFLVNTFKKAYMRNSKLRLLIIGDGIEKEKLKKIVSDYRLNSVVNFQGNCSNVEDYLCAMDIYTMPSLFEGMPNALLEAQATGLKCIASNIITQEASITNNVIYLPLIGEIWEKELIILSEGYERKNVDEEIRRAGYDMKNEIHKLEELYLS